MRFNRKKFAKDIVAFRASKSAKTISVRTTTGLVSLTVPSGLRLSARNAGISAATLSRIERGCVPDIHTFAKICGWMQEEPGKYFIP